MMSPATATRTRTEADTQAAIDPMRAAAEARFREFEATLATAEKAFRRGLNDVAAAYAGLAALTAMQPHAGFFVSPRLERMLLQIGRRTADPTDYRRPPEPRIRRVLHVVSEIQAVGGLTNNLAYWLGADSARTHSLAMIRHRHEIPEGIATSIRNSGGEIFRINKTRGHQVAWAQRLRRISQDHDAVVLHVHGQDPAPLIAFAEPTRRPPVLLLNHADHIFWMGAAIADVVINMREAAADLSVARRGIEQRRNVVVPTVIAPPVRTRSREDARKALGIPADAIVMLSAARRMKYRTVDGVPYTAPFVPLLKKHPRTQLIVLGAGEQPDWKADIDAVGGRIQSFAEQPNARVFHEAADIYVDSYPFVSSTSMMEAAGLGVPLVSRFYGPREARIFAINHPGIDKPTLHAASEQQFTDHLDRLISDPAFREAKGREAREAVLNYHTPPGWLAFIERAYRLAEELPPIDSATMFASDAREAFSHGEPDRSLYEIFGFSGEGKWALMRGYLGVLPLGARISTWFKLRRHGALRGNREALRLLLPDWLVRRLSDRD